MSDAPEWAKGLAADVRRILDRMNRRETDLSDHEARLDRNLARIGDQMVLVGNTLLKMAGLLDRLLEESREQKTLLRQILKTLRGGFNGRPGPQRN